MDIAAYLPISRINQFMYCPRRFWLVYMEHSMVVDAQMLEGILQHYNVHSQSDTKKRTTSIAVCSDRLGLIGTLDALEKAPDGLTVIEHKRGSGRQWVNDQLQVTAQAIAYEETTGQIVSWGSVFSWKTRHRYRFPITLALRQQIEQTVSEMRKLLEMGKRPPPTSETQKCNGCSVRDVCQPAMIRKLQNAQIKAKKGIPR